MPSAMRQVQQIDGHTTVKAWSGPAENAPEWVTPTTTVTLRADGNPAQPFGWKDPMAGAVTCTGYYNDGPCEHCGT